MPDGHAAPQDGDLSGEPMSRRVFARAALGWVGVVYAAGIAYPVYRFLATPAARSSAAGAVREVTLPREQLPPRGHALMFRFGTRPAMLIHHEDGSLVAFSAVCTHLGCTVQFERSAGRIHCACHGGTYDMRTGANVSGPPPKPLTPYTVEMKDDQIVISRA